MRRWLPILVVVVALLLMAVPVAAQPPDGEVSADRVNEIARDLYCPLCPGLTVDVCELQVCDDMKAVIAEQLAEGKSEAEIRQHFYELYGPKAIGAPDKRGSGLIAWVLPGVFALAAVGGGVWWLRRRDADPADTDDGSGHEIDERYAERLERELRRMEAE